MVAFPKFHGSLFLNVQLLHDWQSTVFVWTSISTDENAKMLNPPLGRRNRDRRKISMTLIHRESKSFGGARSLSRSAVGQLRSRHLQVGDYVGIPALFVAGIDCGRGIAVGRAGDHGGIRVQGACIQR
jgi:hypothetical protein